VLRRRAEKNTPQPEGQEVTIETAGASTTQAGATGEKYTAENDRVQTKPVTESQRGGRRWKADLISGFALEKEKRGLSSAETIT